MEKKENVVSQRTPVRRSDIKDKSRNTVPRPKEDKTNPLKVVNPVSKGKFRFIPAMEGRNVANKTEQRATPSRESQIWISFWAVSSRRAIWWGIKK